MAQVAERTGTLAAAFDAFRGEAAFAAGGLGATLLIGAYVVVLAGLFAYVVSLSRRLGAVHRDVERLEADLKRRGRG